MPGADPGEGYKATNSQLYGSTTAPATGTPAPMTGFVTDYAYTLGWQTKDPGWSVLPGTTAEHDHGLLHPGRAAGAVRAGDRVRGVRPLVRLGADRDACPTARSPARAPAWARSTTTPRRSPPRPSSPRSARPGPDLGHLRLQPAPADRRHFTDVATAAGGAIGLFTDFQAAAAAGTLPDFTFLEPSWPSTGNSQHPNYNVALGEQLIHDVYEALRSGPGWAQTLFVLTYDEHGGCFDHVPPPWGATPPDSAVEAAYDFTFNRFGVRVPTVLISPLIAPGTVYRVPAGSTPLDHTSILATVEQRWGLPPLTARDAAAPAFGDVLTLTAPRTDDVLAGVTVPVAGSAGPSAGLTSHLEAIRQQLPVRTTRPDRRCGRVRPPRPACPRGRRRRCGVVPPGTAPRPGCPGRPVRLTLEGEPGSVR